MIGWLPRARVRPAPVPMSIEVGGRCLPIELRPLRHARRMTLRLAPDGSAARISMPAWVAPEEALRFARDRADWLAAQLDRVPAATPLGPGATVPYRGQPHVIVWHAAAPRRMMHDASSATLTLGGPVETLDRRLARWLEGEALTLIAQDLAHYCARVGKPVPALALSRAQRRWGSCAADGTIRINWRLIMAPDSVRRAVIAHEVAHLSHFDHSPAFHAHLGALFEGSIPATNQWLKRHGRSLYVPFG